MRTWLMVHQVLTQPFMLALAKHEDKFSVLENVDEAFGNVALCG